MGDGLKWALVASKLLLTACASYGAIAEHQGSCEATNADFPSMVDCLKRKLGADPRSRGRDADFINLYLRSADVQVERVYAGAISEAEAHLRLIVLHACIKAVADSQPSGIGALGHVLSATGAGMQGRPVPQIPRRDVTHCF